MVLLVLRRWKGFGYRQREAQVGDFGEAEAAVSAPRWFATMASSSVGELPTFRPASTWAVSRSCGMALGETKLPKSSAAKPTLQQLVEVGGFGGRGDEVGQALHGVARAFNELHVVDVLMIDVLMC